MQDLQTVFLAFNENPSEFRRFKLHKIDILPPVSYEYFFREYLLKNKPCIFDQQVTSEWRSRRHWVTADGKPNFSYLRNEFGTAVVPVADCKIKHYNSQPKDDMVFSEYLSYWKNFRESNYSVNEKCLYLKDWHFVRQFPEYEAYETPVYFSSDWLNEFWFKRKDASDDYKFVYMGPKTSWTPFHADVFNSFSWSANICGRKRWILCPPGQEKCFTDIHRNLAYDITLEEILNDPKKFPHFNEREGILDVIQEPGQIIFIPSTWHHQVYNLEDTISINHNWLNGCNIDIVWDFFMKSLKEVQQEIWDCREMENWDQQCQIILKATQGMDLAEFYNFVAGLVQERMLVMKQTVSLDADEEFKVQSSEAKVLSKNCEISGRKFIMFDFLRLKFILMHLIECNEFQNLDLSQCSIIPEMLLEDLNQVISSL